MVPNRAMTHPTNNVPTIGIIGGIGSGKSTIANMFRALGCIVSEADANIQYLLTTKEVIQELVSWWGDAVLQEDGQVNKKAIADIVFADTQERKRLEGFLHPKARLLQEEQFSKANSTTPALVIDAPLLLESGLDELCDAIVYVDVSEKTRIERVEKSRGWTGAELLKREASQTPLDKKRKVADYVVINEGEVTAVQNCVAQILEEICRQQ